MPRLRHLLLVAMLLSLGACDDEPLEPSTLEEHIEMFPELLCAHSEECGPQAGWDFDACMDKLAWSDQALADFKALENEGIASFDAQQGDACIEAIAVHQCPFAIEEERNGLAGLWFDIPECEGVITYRNP